MTTQDSTKVTFNEVYHDLKDALSSAGEALKVGSEHVYEVLVRQQLIRSINIVILDLVLFTSCFVAWKIVHQFVVKKSDQEAQLQSYQKGDWGFMYLIPGILSLITLWFLGSSGKIMLTGFFNPEYGAIMDIKDFIK